MSVSEMCAVDASVYRFFRMKPSCLNAFELPGKMPILQFPIHSCER